MKITRRQLRSIIREAYSVGDPNVDNLTPQLYTADARKGFKPDVKKMNKLKDTKFELNSLNQFVKDFFDDNKPEFDSKQLVLKILHMKEAADQGIGYHGDEKKEIEKALELAEEATGFVASDSYLTQAGEEHFGKDGRDPYIEKSAHFRRQGISENSKSLNRRHLRRLIKEELKKRLLSEMYVDVNNPSYDPYYRAEVFFDANRATSPVYALKPIEMISEADLAAYKKLFNTIDIIGTFVSDKQIYNTTPPEMKDQSRLKFIKQLDKTMPGKVDEAMMMLNSPFVNETEALEMYLEMARNYVYSPYT